jgi:large repetitive protein
MRIRKLPIHLVTPHLMSNSRILRALGIVFFSLIATYFSANAAHAAPTTITGTISSIPTDAYVQVKGEKKVGDTWVDIPGGWTDNYTGVGNYSLNLGEVTGSQIRVWVLADTGSSYLTGGDPITVNSTSITKNFTFGSINVKLQASNPDHCINGSAQATFSDLSYGTWLADSIYASMNSSGIASFSLPAGEEIVFRVYCGSKDLTEVTVTTTSSVQTVTVTPPTPNLVGTISGITNGYDVWGCLEKLIISGTTNLFQCRAKVSVNDAGKFATKAEQGTYRIAFNPSETANIDWVNTYSEVFTIATTQVTVNFTMSTTANFIYTITPSSEAKDGWVNLNPVCAFSKGNEGNECYGSNLYKSIPASGIVKFNVQPGTYILSASPANDQGVYVSTNSPEITVTDSGTVSGTLALNSANLTFIVSPSANARSGWITLTNQSTKINYYCSITSSGNCYIYAPAGTYRAEIYPGNSSSSALFTVISNLVVTGSNQVENITLSSANVTGSVNSTSISAGRGYIHVEQRRVEGVNQYWAPLDNAGGAIDASGNFAISLPEGTFRLLARCNQVNCKDFLSSPSEIFAVSAGNVVVNITLRTANISGTVSELANAIGGYVNVVQNNLNLIKDEYFGLDFGSRINSDGTYQMYLPNGRYSFRANSPSDDYAGIVSELIDVSSTPTTLNLSLVQKNVSGTVSPVAKSKGSYGCTEKLDSGVWSGWDCFSISDTGTYKLYLPAGTYRANVYPNSTATGVFNLTSEPFTVTSGAQTFNFILPATNFSVAISPSSDAVGADVNIFRIISDKEFQHYRSVNVNDSGNIEAYLPNGRYRLDIYPYSYSYALTRSVVFDIPSSSEFPIPTSIALIQSNITGTITPLSSAKYAQVCLEEKINETFNGKTISCTVSGDLGKYKFKAPNGTYRVIVYPQGTYDNGIYIQSPYVVTTSSEFTISNDSKTIDVVLSTGNLSGTITDVAKSAGGWVYALRVDGAYPEWTPYSQQISSSGKYALQLPSGKYRLQIRPPSNSTGVVATESSDITIADTNVVLDIALATPNVSGVVSPIDKSSGGWIYAEQVSCNCGWNGWSGAPGIASSSGINSDGRYGIKVDNGLTRIIAYPRWDAEGVTKTVTDSFTVTSGTPVTKNITLSTGNLTGTISSLENSRGGWVRVERKEGNYWQYTNFGSHVLNNGTYRMQVDNGTYRIVASPGWNSSGVVETPSTEFTINNDSVIKNLTLSPPNLTGTITNLAAAIDLNKLQGTDPKFYEVAWGSIEQKIDGDYTWANKYIRVTADGKFSTYLADGTYRIYIYHLGGSVQGLSRAYSADFTINGLNNSVSFALNVANLRGVISPTSDSAGGWVCAQRQNGANWDWSYCDQIKQDGSYAVTVDAGTYRVIANPNWGSIDYSSAVSSSAAVSADTVTTISTTLTSNNVILKINDLDGRPNYNGWVSIKSGEQYVNKYGKGGWISQLGKVGFSLEPGLYTLEIQPAADRNGVRTTTTITVPATGVLESTITLAAGNVQGVAKKTNNALIACAFITATATGQTTVKAISKSDGTFTLNLASGVTWTVSAVDPETGQVGSQTITPGGTSSNPLIVVTS